MNPFMYAYQKIRAHPGVSDDDKRNRANATAIHPGVWPGLRSLLQHRDHPLNGGTAARIHYEYILL